MAMGLPHIMGLSTSWVENQTASMFVFFLCSKLAKGTQWGWYYASNICPKNSFSHLSWLQILGLFDIKGSAWEECVSTSPRSSSGRSWRRWKLLAPCLASPFTRTKSMWWQESLMTAWPAKLRFMTSLKTREWHALLKPHLSLILYPWLHTSYG